MEQRDVEAVGRDSASTRRVSSKGSRRYWPALCRLLGAGAAIASTPSLLAGQAVGEARVAGESPFEHLRDLLEARDFFSLAALLEDAPPGPGREFLRATLELARNRPAKSIEAIDQVFAANESVPDSLLPRLEHLRYRNYFRLGRYAEALRAAKAALEHPSLPDDLREDLENERLLLDALRSTPPMVVVQRTESFVRREANTRVPVLVEGRRRAYVMDTGANLSVLMRSEAESLGLEILSTGVRIGSITGGDVVADLAVAGVLEVGAVVFENVVFLVLPDEALTFAAGRVELPGILGFPVIEALGEVAFRGTEALLIAGEVPSRAMWNLALDNLTPLVRVRVLEDHVVCRLDSGADRSAFRYGFYRNRRERIDSLTKSDTVRFAGAGGEVKVLARVFPELRIEVGDTAVVAEELPVYTEPLSEREPAHTPCYLGLDVLTSFREYVVNFRSMTLLLR